MSEFKVGDHIVIDQKYDKTFMPVLQILSEGKNYFYCNDGQVHKSQMDQWCKAEPQEIAAGHRIDKSPLMQHLDECVEVVKTWPNWKVESVRKAFGIPDLGDDSHIENHISPNCKVEDV